MPDDQFSPGSSPDPANDNFDVSTLAHDGTEPSLSPIGTPLPNEWSEPPDDSTMPDDATIILPDGAQYPDDVFGAPPADEAPVTLPAIEPEPLALPTDETPARDTPASNNGDMFSIDDLMDKPAAIAGDEDMFSVDELIGEDENAVGEGGNDLPAEHDAADPSATLAVPQPTETPDLLGPYGITQSQTAMPASDFAFTEPAAPLSVPEATAPGPAPEAPAALPLPEATESAPAPEAHYDTNAFEPPVEPLASEPRFDAAPQPAVAPALDVPAPPSVVNPYATMSNEPAEVEPVEVDPAMPTDAAFEPPVTAAETADARPIVNPYATMPDEPMAIEAVPTPSVTFPTQPEPEPIPQFEFEPEPYPHESEPAYSPEAGPEPSPLEPAPDASMPPTYGATSYADPETYTTPLPPTDRTVSVAPPGMDVTPPAGPIVAGSKRTPGKPSKAPKAPKVPKPPKPAKPPKPPKQGKSLADVLLGKVEPGQRHKIFGIPVGKPAPPNAP